MQRRDVLLTLPLVVLAELELWAPWDDGFRAGSRALAVVVTAILVGALALGRSAPGLALLIMWSAVVVPGLLGPVTVLFFGGIVPLIVMTVAAARHDPGVVGRVAWLSGPLLALSQVHDPGSGSVSDLAFGLGLTLVAWGIGRTLRATDRRREQLNSALDELHARRADGQAAARQGERQRIAGEMHDVVGNAVSLMVLQIGAARSQLSVTHPESATLDRLRAAEGAGRTALEDLRSVMARLRTSDAS